MRLKLGLNQEGNRYTRDNIEILMDRMNMEYTYTGDNIQVLMSRTDRDTSN
jgi:hypothetical protein